MSSDDDAYGPALPPGLVRKKPAGPSPPRSIGPSIGPARPRSPSDSPPRRSSGPIRPARPGSISPPRLAPLRPVAGPSRPPGPSIGPSIGPARPGPVGPSRPPGPSLPGPSLPGPSRAPGPAPPPDDDSDDEIGPQLSDLAPVPQRSAADAFREREARMAKAREDAANAPKKPQRDEWMTIGPPTGLSHIDALKRPTQFQKHSRETAAVDQTWMESPAERAAREREEGAGKRKAGGEEERDAKRRRERDDQMRRRIEEHSVGLVQL